MKLSRMLFWVFVLLLVLLVANAAIQRNTSIAELVPVDAGETGLIVDWLNYMHLESIITFIDVQILAVKACEMIANMEEGAGIYMQYCENFDVVGDLQSVIGVD